MIRQRKSPTSPTSPSPSHNIPKLDETPSSPSPSVARSTRSARSRPAAEAQESAEAGERQPLLERADDEGEAEETNEMPSTWATRNSWLVFALASGACAAFNGVFAKLTTTDLTTKFAQGIAAFLNLESIEGGIEVVVRGTFFILNLVFNGIMWSLFTTALARGNSTTQVSILNTSTNFVITALLGFAIFSESLPPLWWAGATLLIAGNVIIGRKDEGSESEGDGESGEEGGVDGYRPLAQDPGVVGAELELDGDDGEGKDDDAPDLGSSDGR